MKKALPSILLFAALTYLLPFAGLLLPAFAAGQPDGQSPAPGTAGLWAGRQPAEPAPAPDSPAPDAAGPQQPGDGGDTGDGAGLAGLDIQLWDEGAGRLLSVPVEEYLIGVMAAEMPPDWPDEALKAQAVAAHSYVLYQRAHADTAALEGGWLAADPARRQGFMTDEVLRSYWGEAYEQNYARLAGLAAEVKNELLLYGTEPAAACYHAISSGATEASQNVWGEALPYLQGVDSPLDLTSPDYEKTVTYTPQQMYDALLLGCEGLSLEGGPSGWFGDVRYTGAGYVAEIEIGGQMVAGPAVRAALGLRSACFTVDYADGVFTVTTRGYGHGVGLSQYGANALALTGRTHEEILAFYYPGTALGVG